MTGKRILALILDWVAAILVVQVIPNAPAYATPKHSLLTLIIFGTEVALFHLDDGFIIWAKNCGITNQRYWY